MGLFYSLPVILVNFDIKRPSGDVYRGTPRAGSTRAVVTVNGKRCVTTDNVAA